MNLIYGKIRDLHKKCMSLSVVYAYIHTYINKHTDTHREETVSFMLIQPPHTLALKPASFMPAGLFHSLSHTHSPLQSKISLQRSQKVTSQPERVVWM